MSELVRFPTDPPPGYDLIHKTGEGWASWGWRVRLPRGGLVVADGYASGDEAAIRAWVHHALQLQLENWPRIAGRIARMIGVRFGVTFDELRNRRRTLMLVRARQFTWWLLRDLTPASYPEIAAVFRRDHTTVIAGVRRIHRDHLEAAQRLRLEIVEELTEQNERRRKC